MVYFSLHLDSAWILRNYKEKVWGFFKFIAFKIFTLAHDIRKNTVIFIVISNFCHTSSPSLFLLHCLSICFHVLLKNIPFSPLSLSLNISFCLLSFSYAVVTTVQLCELYSKVVCQREYLLGKDITQWGAGKSH